METPHDPKYDDIERDVEELFRVHDLAIHAIYNQAIERLHQKETDPQEFA